jgi:hypothetical protein
MRRRRTAVSVASTKQVTRMAAVEPMYVGVDGAETMTGVSRWTWRAYCYEGRVESTKVGTRLLIPLSEIHRVLAEGTRPRGKGERVEGFGGARGREK